MPVLLFTSNNLASKNIAEQMVSLFGYEKKKENEWEKDGVRLIDTHAPTVLEVPTDFDTDCIIILSSHKSVQEKPCLTAHVPGNWDKAGMGGEPRTLNTVHAVLLKYILQEMENVRKEEGVEWGVCMEADHHGPTCSVPILFAEIGSSERQWKDEAAARTVARAVQRAIERLGEDKTPETVAGFGGGHYCREFTKMMLEGGVAVGHVAPKYAIDSVEKDTFSQAIEKSVGKTAKVVVLKDSTNLGQKNKIKKLAEEAGVQVELV